MNKQRVAGRSIRAGLLFPSALVLALAACSSRPSQGSGPFALRPPIGDPIIKVVAAETASGLSFLSWDTEGGEKAATNLLRAGNAVRVQYLADGAWNDAKLVDRRPGSGGDIAVFGLEAGTACLEWRIVADSGSLKLTLFALDAKPTAPLSLRLIFPFDPKVTSTTILPGDWLDDGTFRLPAVLNAPDWGPMLLAETKGRPLIGRLEGNRADKIVDLTLDLPAISPDQPVALSVTPLLLPAPPGLRDTDLWLAARRGWLNALQPDAIGIPTREDGTDTVGHYMNGGITAGHVLHFLMAHYVLGENDRADRILRAMLERQHRGEFQNGVCDATADGIDWTDWNGKPTGYEGYLADSFRFLQAVLMREKSFRAKLYGPLRSE